MKTLRFEQSFISDDASYIWDGESITAEFSEKEIEEIKDLIQVIDKHNLFCVEKSFDKPFTIFDDEGDEVENDEWRYGVDTVKVYNTYSVYVIFQHKHNSQAVVEFELVDKI